jgi:pyocin large subunit-like protein
VEAYAVAKGSDELAQMAMEIKLRAERKAGQFLADMKEAGTLGDGKFKTVGHDVPPQVQLKDLGVEPQESKRWQRIAAIPEEKFEEVINSAKKKTQSAFLEKTHVNQATGEDEWYTPQDYIEQANGDSGN